jgi:uncharacterized membrane protein
MFMPRWLSIALISVFVFPALIEKGHAGQMLAIDNTPAPRKIIITRQQNKNTLSADQSLMLEETHATLQSLAGLMGKHAMMNQQQLQAIADIMQHLSLNLQALSQPMTDANSASANLAAIRERNFQLNKTIEELQLQLNDN